jgi:hypothetical protein
VVVALADLPEELQKRNKLNKLSEVHHAHACGSPLIWQTTQLPHTHY